MFGLVDMLLSMFEWDFDDPILEDNTEWPHEIRLQIRNKYASQSRGYTHTVLQFLIVTAITTENPTSTANF